MPESQRKQNTGVKEVITTTEFKVSTAPIKQDAMEIINKKQGSISKSIEDFRGRISWSGSQTGTNILRDEREREKKELSNLNDRLASYIEKVRFLDAQNRKMSSDYKLFQARMGSDVTTTRKMYEGEIKEARHCAAETKEEQRGLEDQVRKLEKEIADYIKRYNSAKRAHEDDKSRINAKIEDLCKCEQELNLYRRRINESEAEVEMLKKLNSSYLTMHSEIRNRVEQESMLRLDQQNRHQMIYEEKEFTCHEQDQEIKDLQGRMIRDTTYENREYFKNELAAAIRSIRDDYEKILAANRSNIEAWYNGQIHDIQLSTSRKVLEQNYSREELKRLRSQQADLRVRQAKIEGRNSQLEKEIIDLKTQLKQEQILYKSNLEDRDAMIHHHKEECEALEVELQNLLDTKRTLEQEINKYRELLEGEEHRTRLQKIVRQVIEQKKYEKPEEKASFGSWETVNKATINSKRSNISIMDVDKTGKYIILENKNKTKEISLSGWKIIRSFDIGPDIVYTFPKNIVLKPLKTTKIWAKDQGGVYAPPDQLIFEEGTTFGCGTNEKTILVDQTGKIEAEYYQQSININN